MIEERLRFDFLEFTLSQVIGKDGSTSSQSTQTTYIPSNLKAKMAEKGFDTVQKLIDQEYFSKQRKEAVEEECKQEDYVVPQQREEQESQQKHAEKKGNRFKLSARDLLRNQKVRGWQDSDSDDAQ